MSRQDAIGAAARELCATILEHAAACEREPENAPRIISMVEKINSLVRAYSDVLFEGSGWSNPLIGIEEAISGPQVEPRTVEGATAAEEPHGDRVWVSIVDNHAMFVEDPSALIAYAEERTGEKVQGVVEALRALCLLDGWNPNSYPEGLIQMDWRSTDVCTG